MNDPAPPAEGLRPAHLLPPAAALLAVSALVLWRLAETPLIPMVGGWEYAAPTYRLWVADQMGQLGLLGVLTDFGALDRDFPPGMHVLSALLGPITGHSPFAVTAQNLLWLALLGGSMLSAGLRLGLTPAGAGRASALAILVPSVHGAACRYYYDLPMTALLFALFAAALARPERRRWLQPLVVGALLAAAALVKWPAVPLGLITLAAAAVVTRRFVALGVAALVGALLVFVLYGGRFDGTSLDWMASLMAGGEKPPTQPRPEGGVTALLSTVDLASRLHPARLAWYPLVAITACLSPLLAAAIAWPSARGLRRGPRPALAAVGVLVLGQLAFHVVFVEVLDARFALSWVPALALVAALGWQGSGPRARRGMEVAAASAALLVAADLHLGLAGPLAAPWTVQLGSTPVIEGRGLSVASSVEALGWVRRDEQSPGFLVERAALWQAIVDAGVPRVGLEPTAPLVSPMGDEPFLRWRAQRARLEGEPSPRFLSIPPATFEDVELLLVRAPAWPLPGWRTVQTVHGCELRRRSDR